MAEFACGVGGAMRSTAQILHPRLIEAPGPRYTKYEGFSGFRVWGVGCRV